MTRLRQRTVEDRKLRGLAEKTQATYVDMVRPMLSTLSQLSKRQG